MASKIHGKQIKDTSVQLAKINPATGQTLALQGTSKIQQAAAPTTDNDLTNKYYVDSVAAGFDPKESCRLATIADLSGATYSAIGGTSGTGALYNTPLTLDGVGLTGGDRILVKDQIDTKQNGIYVVVGPTATWYRTSDMDGNPTTEISVGNFTFVTEGSTLAGNGFVVMSSGTWSGILPVNTAPILWTQFSGGGSFIWGDGLSNIGNIINVDLAGNSGLTVSGGKLTVDTNIAGSGIAMSAGVINIGAGAGITVNANDIQVDYTNVSQTLGGAGLTGTGILNVGAADGITVNADSVGINYTEAAIGLEGAGLTASGGKINIIGSTAIGVNPDSIYVKYDPNTIGLDINGALTVISAGDAIVDIIAGKGLTGSQLSGPTASLDLEISTNGGLTFSDTTTNGTLQLDYITTSQVLGGAGLTGSGILNVGAANGITVNADSVGINYTEAAIALEGNGLTASAGVISVNTSNGITIINDSVQLDQLVAGNGLTFSSGVININVAKGVTFSGDYLFADASTINTTAYLPFVNVATNSTIQSALTTIDSTLSGLQSTTFISTYSNPTGTFLSSISVPVAINTGVTFSRQSDGEAFVFINGVNYPVGSATSSDFFFANGSVYSGSLTASNSVYVGQYLWSNVNTLSFDIDITDEIIVKYNAI